MQKKNNQQQKPAKMHIPNSLHLPWEQPSDLSAAFVERVEEQLSLLSLRYTSLTRTEVSANSWRVKVFDSLWVNLSFLERDHLKFNSPYVLDSGKAHTSLKLPARQFFHLTEKEITASDLASLSCFLPSNKEQGSYSCKREDSVRLEKKVKYIFDSG